MKGKCSVMQEDRTFLEIEKLCKENGFYKRRNAFFRVYGDGIVQILQYEKKKRPYPRIDLMLGLYSMYGEIDPRELTSARCVCRYATNWLKPGAKEGFFRKAVCGGQYTGDWIYEVDVVFTKEHIIPMLNGLKTQQELAETLCYLDRYAGEFTYGPVIWNDLYKYYSYLRSGNLKLAQKAINAIVDQRESAKEWRRQTFSPEDFEAYVNHIKDEDDWYKRLKELAESENVCAINEYLENNYRNNLKLVQAFNKKSPRQKSNI